jgi:hypothetical protein
MMKLEVAASKLIVTSRTAPIRIPRTSTGAPASRLPTVSRKRMRNGTPFVMSVCSLSSGVVSVSPSASFPSCNKSSAPCASWTGGEAATQGGPVPTRKRLTRRNETVVAIDRTAWM